MQLRGGVKFIEEMPKNPRGKILKQRLKDMLLEMLKEEWQNKYADEKFCERKLRL